MLIFFSDKQINLHVRALKINEKTETLKIATFKGRTDTDHSESWLINVAFTDSSSLIVTDANNKKLKKFSLRGKRESELGFPTRPMFLTVFEDGMIYVTFPDEPVLRIVTDSMSKLEKVNSFEVPMQCSGIATCGEDAFAFCVRGECEIRIMQRNGITIRSIRPVCGVNEIGGSISTSQKNQDDAYDTDEERDSHAEPHIGKKDFSFYKKHRSSVDTNNILVMPGFMTSSKDGLNFYVTDYNSKNLTAVYLDDDGKISNQSVSLNEPRGVAINDDTLFVAAGTLRLFDLNLAEHGEIPLHGGQVTYPRSVALGAKNRYLAITHKGDGGDRISVYQLFAVM